LQIFRRNLIEVTIKLWALEEITGLFREEKVLMRHIIGTYFVELDELGID